MVKVNRWISQLIIACLVILVSGCTFEKVKPWQRARLAHPVMVRDANPAQSTLEQHTYSSKESTSGGYSTGAGGCGCN